MWQVLNCDKVTHFLQSLWDTLYDVSNLSRILSPLWLTPPFTPSLLNAVELLEPRCKTDPKHQVTPQQALLFHSCSTTNP